MVADTFANISTSNLELPGGVFATKPAQCMNFQELFPPHRGATDVTIINAICEGVSADGWVLQKSSGNVFVGGTSESNTGRGIVVDATSERNTFLNVDVENNTGEDVTVAGNYNQIINMTASSVVGSPVHIVQGTNNTISGGTFNRLTIDAAAANTLLSNVRYNMAGGGLTNNSTTTAIINSTDGTTTTTQLRGVTTATAPPAGMIGEELVSTVVIGSAVPLVNGAAKTVTSIVLTPGDWDVTGIGYFTGSSATKVAYIYATLSPIDNGLDQDPGRSGVMPFFYTAPLLTDINQVSQDAGTSRFTVAANTTVYLVVQASFNSGTWSAFGYLRARRMR
jgi:hypothetical protein